VLAEACTAIVMLVRPSSVAADCDRFIYQTSFSSDPITLEWEKGASFGSFPVAVVSFLVSRKYARLATDEDVARYHEQREKEKTS